MKKLSLLAVLAAMAIAVPATAKPAHPTTSHKCGAHAVSYRASGMLVSSALTQNSDGTWSGMLTVAVTSTNHHARADKGTTVTYALTSAKGRLGHGVSNPPAAGSRVHLKGTITTIASKCSTTAFTPTTTIGRVVILAARSK